MCRWGWGVVYTGAHPQTLVACKVVPKMALVGLAKGNRLQLACRLGTDRDRGLGTRHIENS